MIRQVFILYLKTHNVIREASCFQTVAFLACLYATCYNKKRD